MASRSVVTDYYTVEITVRMVERNSYGDALNDNVITFTEKLRVTAIDGVAYLLTQLKNAVTNAREMSR